MSPREESFSASVFNLRCKDGPLLPLLVVDEQDGSCLVVPEVVFFMQAMVARGESLSKLRGIATTLALLHDYMTVAVGAAPVTPESLPELIAGFLRRRRHLPTEGDSLPWQPVKRETVERDRHYLRLFSEFCSTRFGHWPLVPLRAACPFEEGTLPATSESILTTLLAEAGNDRRRDTLQRLKAACDTLVARGAPFKLTDVQRVVEEQHGADAGPKAQSISNERKRPLGMYHYVEARERELAAAQAPRRTARHGRTETALTSAIDRIPDIDVRSAVHDMHDRMVVAEKALERANALFKALQPGADVERLLAGQGGLPAASSPGIPTDQVEALQRLVGILTDDAKLAEVGLSFDGRRVRRKTGTRDELVSPAILADVSSLLALLKSSSM